ncbi:hypothetical protein ACTFIW_003752 [Dictyostelium discoideum]
MSSNRREMLALFKDLSSAIFIYDLEKQAQIAKDFKKSKLETQIIPYVSDTLYYQYFNHDKNIRLLKGSIRTDARRNVNSEQVVQWPKDQHDLINNKAPKTSLGKVTIQTQGTIIFNESGWRIIEQWELLETSWDATASPITIKNAFEMVKIDWNLIKTSNLNELENNDNKSLAFTSNNLVLNVKPSSSTKLQVQKLLGFKLTVWV